MDALRRAGVQVHQQCQPEMPAGTAPAGCPPATTVRGAVCVAEGEMPAARVHLR